MNELSELEQRILSELEEFGERDIVPLINVALTTSGSDRDIEALTEALSQLLRRGLIEIGFETFRPRNFDQAAGDAADGLIRDLGRWLRYGEHGPYWHYKQPMTVSPSPAVVATAPGRQEARSILARRGYQWWGPPRCVTPMS